METYDELLHAIREARAQSRGRIEQAVEAEKVREAWEVGKLIDEHVLQHKERAEYGKQVLGRLSEDLEISQTELSFMLQFARAYPIYSPGNKLSWSHYRSLLVVNDSAEREELARRAEREGWTRDRLREEVARRRAPADAPRALEEPLVSQPGQTHTYRVVKAHYGNRPDQLVLDLGFSNYYKPDGLGQFKEGDIVTAGAALRLMKEATESDLFTFPVDVIHVIDGDTFTAAVDLGFGIATVQTLRLRGLDAPEIESSEGREAKAFLEARLTQSRPVVIKTVRSDKYDRYLADVFVDGRYVNQELIEKNLAERMPS